VPDELVAGGGAGMVRWRLGYHGLPVPAVVEYAYLRQVAEHRRMAGLVRQLRPRLRFPPLVVKGCAAAARYPAVGMRPVGGDIDVLVADDHVAAVDATLHGSGLATLVDVARDHHLRAEPATVDLTELDARGLATTDDLRYCAMHFVKHGGIRPFWLCDVAVLLEAPGAALDWAVVLDGPPPVRDAVACVLRLARDLLGAVLPADAPPALARPVPGWVVDSVLRSWGSPDRRPAAQPPLTSVGGVRAWVGRGRQPPVQVVGRLGLDWEHLDTAALHRDLARRAVTAVARRALRR
jgi:hypothetical protein